MTDEITGRARGGAIRAAKMTVEERKAQSMRMVEAKKELAALPKVTHPGTLKLIDQEIPCAVLEDGTRVLTQSDFMEAMGMYYSGWIAKNTLADASIVPAEIPHFLAQKSLIPYINKHLGHLQNIVLKYRTEKGSAAHGIKAEIIPSICDIYIDADKAGKLGSRQKQIAQKAMLLMRALAHVGIIALVDEATGYQRDRARDALAKILEAYVAKELQPYVKTFDSIFYEQMFRLRGLDYPPEKVSYRPSYFGHLTNDIVYSRLAPGVLKALKEEAKKDGIKTHLHRHLTPGYGKLELIKHLSLVIAYMRDSSNWQDFVAKLNKYAPRSNDTLPLDLDEVDR
ncbi:MAG: P63C domain-containing protein [Acidiferrobacterales bacterium]